MVDRSLRIAAHRQLLAQERAASDQLASEQRQVARLRTEAATLDTAAKRAVAERTALLDDLDRRRELAAQYVGELEQARVRLQSTLSGLTGSGPSDLPLRPFQGDLPWPVSGRVIYPPGQSVPNNLKVSLVGPQRPAPESFVNVDGSFEVQRVRPSPSRRLPR